MIKARHFASLATALLCAACGGNAGNPNETTLNETDSTPAAAATASPIPPDITATPAEASAGSPPLADYVGKYPFDEVGGTAFLANPLVRAAVTTAVGEKAVLDWVLNPQAGPSGPIILKDGQLLAAGCQAHNCGDHRWTILIDPAGSTAQVCYHDAEKMGETARWYSAGKREARTNICPQE